MERDFQKKDTREIVKIEIMASISINTKNIHKYTPRKLTSEFQEGAWCRDSTERKLPTISSFLRFWRTNSFIANFAPE